MRKAIAITVILAAFYLGKIYSVGGITRNVPSILKAEDAQALSSSTEPAPRTIDEQENIDVYRRTNKAVVNVSLLSENLDIFGPAFQQGSGSGVVVDPARGLVVTNAHVVANASKLAVTLSTGQTYDVEVKGFDQDSDLALLQLKDAPRDLVGITFGSSENLEVGQRVLAIGNPFGLNRTLTTGIISSLGRSIRSESGTIIEDVIQTDAAINPGNSGGPLLDAAGRLIGINTAILSKVGESSGIGFAIPVEQVLRALPQLEKFGRVLRPKIGVIFLETEYGVAIGHVEPGSPADKAGLEGAQVVIQRGFFTRKLIDLSKADFVEQIGNKKVNSRAEALGLIGKAEPGKALKMKVRRGGQRKITKEVEVVPELG